MDYIELENARKKALLKAILYLLFATLVIIVGLFFLIKFIDANNEGLAVLASVVTLLVWAFVSASSSTAASDFEIQVKEKLLPSVLKNIMQGRGKIKWCSHLDCYASKNNDKTYDLFRDGDCRPQEIFEGTYHNVKFSLSEYEEYRGSGKSRYNLIRGNVIKISTNIDYIGKMVIGRKIIFANGQVWRARIFHGAFKVKNMPLFTNKRSLFADNQNGFDKILTAEFVDFVNNLPKNFYVVFLDSDLYIIYSTTRDTFKMGSLWKKVDDPKQYARFESDLMEALNIVEKTAFMAVKEN